MVLDCCVTIASTIISILMNGICCMHQQREEQKLREAIRQDIRSEYLSVSRQQQKNVYPTVVIEKPIPLPNFGANKSIDEEESVFIMSSLHIQEGCRANLMKQKRKVKSGLPFNLSQVSNNDTNVTMSSGGESTSCFKHNETLSPFLTLTNHYNNSRSSSTGSNKSEIKEDDFDEEVQRITTSSTSWTTISII